LLTIIVLLHARLFYIVVWRQKFCFAGPRVWNGLLLYKQFSLNIFLLVNWLTMVIVTGCLFTLTYFYLLT